MDLRCHTPEPGAALPDLGVKFIRDILKVNVPSWNEWTEIQNPNPRGLFVDNNPSPMKDYPHGFPHCPLYPLCLPSGHTLLSWQHGRSPTRDYLRTQYDQGGSITTEPTGEERLVAL